MLARQALLIGFLAVVSAILLLASTEDAKAQLACPTTTIGGGIPGDNALPGVFTANGNSCNASTASIFVSEYSDLPNQCAFQARFVAGRRTSDALCLALPHEGDLAATDTNGMRVAFAEGTTQTANNISTLTCPGATSITGVGTTLGEVILADGASCVLTALAPAIGGGTYGLSGSTISRVGGDYFMTAGTISGGAYGGAAAGTSPALAVSGNLVAIPSGDTTPSAADGTILSAANIGGTATTQNFSIANSGTGQLTISSIAFSGDAASEFSVTSAPATNTAPSGGTTTFTVSFAPTVAGTRNAVLEINSNDPTNDPYTFALQGTGVDVTDPTVSLSRSVTANPTNVSTITVTATFSEAVTGFVAGDVVVSSNATVSNFNDTLNPIFTFDVTANSDGAVTVDVPANSATDASANGNTAATQLGWTFDGTGPVVAISGPSDVQSSDFRVTINVSGTTAALALGDLVATNAALSDFDATSAPTSYSVLVSPTFGQTVSVSVPANALVDGAGNGNNVASYAVLSGNALSEFQANEAELQNVIQSDARRMLVTEMSTNTAMMGMALDRFIGRDTASGNAGTRNDLGGFLQFDINDLASRMEGSFHDLSSTPGLGKSRYAFGDFALVEDQTGSMTGQAAGRVSWEYERSETLSLGVFIGGSVARSDVKGTISGDVDSVGLVGGGYALNRLADNLFATAYLGVGKTWSDFSGSTASTGGSGLTTFDASYDSESYYAGLELSGSHTMRRFEVRPALSFDFGQTDVGVVGFNTAGFGTTAIATSDLGQVSIAELAASAKVIFPVDLSPNVEAQFNVEPSTMCRRQTSSTQTSKHCGLGLNLSMEASNQSGSLNYGVRFGYAEAGDLKQSSLGASLSMAF